METSVAAELQRHFGSNTSTQDNAHNRGCHGFVFLHQINLTRNKTDGRQIRVMTWSVLIGWFHQIWRNVALINNDLFWSLSVPKSDAQSDGLVECFGVGESFPELVIKNNPTYFIGVILVCHRQNITGDNKRRRHTTPTTTNAVSTSQHDSFTIQ